MNRTRSRKRNRRNRTVVLYVFAGLFALSAGLLYCFKQDVFGAATKPQITEYKTERSAWLADWRWEAGMEQLGGVAGGLTSLQVFAAYFDESDRLLFTEEFREALPKIKQEAERNGMDRLFLTLVNDIKYESGSDVQKDADLVSRLVKDYSSRNRHINEIIAVLETYGLSGAELDYERIGDRDWPNFVQLIRELHARMSAKGKELRVVFEPRAPLERLDLPEGPVYVMMAYNLYGSHSGPGPKADDAFVRKLAAQMKDVSAKSYIALSSGGFDWHGGTGKATGITERQAAELARSAAAAPVRDKASGALNFEYTDSGGAKHKVWYADGATLSQWIQAAKSKGIYNIAVWRLDELGAESLEQLRSSGSNLIE
ncbi:hypothetical protein B1A99_07095 [Cohnella sp. CIP 111063]|uniref:glycosyl hydrolase family 18 protein n=1 Tax=unclassified Cohnella TaxID=2636738 RepID=UPI000B8C07FC|nr:MULTISPECIES: glycosyl hydrolase family 18 protein [unclassified Cohnella]OXS61269.1 hypothetical protein B1A99_07095 [Cohnella sp. CIP 111063]PRX73844.1 glycosyl hydrolase family 18 (putative chitinase) [Cohnella sp. SGD-V74]